jgi:POT family proton-dependent oligopeptide transporter
MTWFQSLNGLLVILLTPLLLALWRRRLAQSATAARMAMGAAITGLAFLLAAGLSLVAEATGEATEWPWIALFFVLITTGELYILPVGLGLFGRLAPRRIGATIMSFWFAAISAGSLLSGVLGTYWSVLGAPAFFAMIAAVAGAASLLCVLLIPWVRRVEERCEAAQGAAG